ncbi:MAG TPA: nucleotidyltransferase [Acidocella sp.]|nr:nucleotidyltransferase [Acidocella sp.]
MGIVETQLDTWSKQGAITQSSTTYSAIKNALEAVGTLYSGKSFSTFLQGSYGNDTNIYADSDVDVVIRLDSLYYRDLSGLSPEDQVTYNHNTSTSEYSFAKFKTDVTSQLVTKFGTDVKAGNKAIQIKAGGGRRKADVLVCADFRKYLRYKSPSDKSYVEGITFWAADGTQIINYPNIHSSNLTKKHQGTNQWFKPTVRIFKNIRNKMIDDGYIEEGLAPSYFIEGMLYNVPNENFGTRYGATVVNAINWLSQADKSRLVCANDQYYLLREASPVTWRVENYSKFISSIIRYWNDR